MSTKFSSRENVKVIIRYRPVNKLERKHDNDPKLDSVEPMTWDEKASNVILGKKNRKQWGFDGVAGPTLDQETMFRIVAEQTCKDVLNGYNGTIFVYGQTGSGKTYTMYGAEDKPDDVSLMGVIPRCVSYIFNEINEDKDIDTFRVTCSFLEIYQEKLRDLLNSKKNQDLKIRLNKRHETYVQGLVEHQVESITDVLQLISIAVNNRVTDSTNMNAVSSRSHMLMKMTVVVKLKDGTIRIAAANFADLAGSEKVKKTGARGTRLDEAKSINKSLSVLGMVINALSKGTKKHVPFRDSMLTHTLRDSLGGNCKTTLVVTVSPHKYNRTETINALRFGRRCKLVTNKASVNRVYSNDELMRRLALLEAKNEELQLMLKQKAYESFQNTELPKQIELLQKEMAETKNKLKLTQNENDNLDKIIKSLRNEKLELEDKYEKDKEQIEIFEKKIQKLEKIIINLKSEFEKQKQKEEYMNNQQELLSDKLKQIENENNEMNKQINGLQNDLNVLRQFKYDTQQENIENIMKQEQQRNEMNKLKQQIEQQSLQYQQQITNEKNQTISIQKELNLEQEKIKMLMEKQDKLENETQQLKNEKESVEQEKLKYEQELLVKEKEIQKQVNELQQLSVNKEETDMKEATVNQSDIDNAIKEKEEELNKLFKTRQNELILKYEKINTEKVNNIQLKYDNKNKELISEYKRKEFELISREEQLRNEIKQELTIKIKNEMDREFNSKNLELQEQFKSQLTTLQTALNESHIHTQSMRNDIEEERKKNKELQGEYNNQSDKILEIETENKQLLTELQHLRNELLAKEQQKNDVNIIENEYKERIELYEEDKDKLLQEKELFSAKVEEERRKMDAMKEDFQRQAELFGAKEKAQADLLHKEKQEKESVKSQLTEHRGVIEKSHHLLAKQNKLLKQRESKIYSLVEKQTTYLDGMNNLRNIQIGMDEDVAKRLLDEEAEAERKRKKELEEQRRRDEEYVRSLLMQEHKSVPNKDIKGHGAQKSRSKSKNMKQNSISIEYDMGRRKDVEQLMQVSNANSKSNLSQQIASVALAQQRDRLMGGKVKKSILDLWIKSQMQLMCGQLPTLCKKYGVQLNRLDDMYGDKKPDYQPKIDQLHYLKFRSANFDPKEFDITPNGNNNNNNNNTNNKLNINPLLDESKDDDYDPYGHYNENNNESGMRIAAKPQGFVAQPMSPINRSQSGVVINDGYELNENIDQNGNNHHKKSKIKNIFKRKSKGNVNGNSENASSKKHSKKDKKKKHKNSKKKKKNKTGKNSPSSGISSPNSPQQMEFEDGPAPVPFGQYLKHEDLQHFEKIKNVNNGNNNNNNNNNNNIELEEDINIDKYRYPKTKQNNYNNNNNNNGHIHNKNESSSNESLEYDVDIGTNVMTGNHQSVATNATMITHNSYMSGSVTHSREVSMSNSRNIINKNNNNINNFSAVTELLKSGEFGGIIISTQFGLIGTKPHLKIQINNQNIRGLEISKLFISFNKNYIGISTIKNNKNVLYDQIIGYKEKYQFSIGLILNSSESIMESGLIKNNQFDYSAELIINTNGNKNKIKCQLFVPIHLFFTGRGTIPRDQFLQLWKSIPPKQESKLQINKSRSNDMEHIKSLLLIHKLYFIHHRNIPNKGNILYYSAKMYGQILLCEISIALSGKGTVVVRSKDKYKSNLCVNAIQLIIDNKNNNDSYAE